MRPTVALVSWAGRAEGSKAAAAALACAGSEPDRAALLMELADGRAPRPALVATAAARALEERLAGHLPEAAVASRGRVCHLTLPADGDGIARVPAALALVRDSAGVVHLPPRLVHAALEENRIEASAALLRADLDRDRSLAALAVRDIRRRGLPVAVLKRPLGWIPSRLAHFGALPADAVGGLPPWVLARLGLADAPGRDGPSSRFPGTDREGVRAEEGLTRATPQGLPPPPYSVRRRPARSRRP